MSVVRSRLKGRMDPLALEFTSSLDHDRKIFYYDILVDMAHVLGLLKCGHIGREDARDILRALTEVRKGGYESLPKDCEDVHEAIEKAVTAITPAGKRMHTARSRNDEVATCLRMFARDKLLSLASSILELRRVLLSIAERHIRTIMPGFTHLQYAQPTLLSHWALAYHDMLKRDFDRAMEAFERANRSPLGSCAFAGTSFELDRRYTAELLGFDGIVENSCDAVAGRDFVIETVFVSTSAMVTLSRMAEEIILWSSEFDFIELSDEYASSSSIMPQKKNPDVAELIRAKASKLIGDLSAILSIYKALPMTYNRDFQEMNPILYESVEIADLATMLMARMLESMRFKVEVMQNKALKGYAHATEVADAITKAGIPFRDAHKIVGALVAKNLEPTKENVRKMCLKFGYDVDVDFDVSAEGIVMGRRSEGSASYKEVERMLRDRLVDLERDRERIVELIDRIAEKLERLHSTVLDLLRS